MDSSAKNQAPVEIIRALAAQKVMRAGPKYDPRVRLWETALAAANPRASSEQLMAVLAWLWFKRRVRDWGVLDRVTKLIAQAENPYAMLQPGGKALEALVGKLAVGRAEAEQTEHREADKRMGIGR